MKIVVSYHSRLVQITMYDLVDLKIIIFTYSSWITLLSSILVTFSCTQ